MAKKQKPSGVLKEERQAERVAKREAKRLKRKEAADKVQAMLARLRAVPG